MRIGIVGRVGLFVAWLQLERPRMLSEMLCDNDEQASKQAKKERKKKDWRKKKKKKKKKLKKVHKKQNPSPQKKSSQNNKQKIAEKEPPKKKEKGTRKANITKAFIILSFCFCLFALLLDWCFFFNKV
jgi:Flp pilus assembly protein TadB